VKETKNHAQLKLLVST